ncbi:MAG: MraY family glycosyltransferase [Phycisphaerales bacterium JB039]
MPWLTFLLVLVSMAVSLPMTALAMTLGRRLGAHDTPGVAGQVKDAARKVPNTGGVGVFAGVAVPLAAGLALLAVLSNEQIARVAPQVADYLDGARSVAAAAWTVLAATLALHVVGLIDDRRPMGPWVKLAVMIACASAVVLVSEGTGLLTLLDEHVGGPWLSTLLAILWIVVITNAMNFLDNMDGLAGGVGLIASGLFLIAAMIQGQWFVAATLAMLAGALAGFLPFNVPPARVFMGDSGSLVLGFLLGFLTVRTTYYSTDAGTPYAVFMPVITLAVPLYDFITVVTIRISQGRSPFVGDLQHVSHRLVQRGMSKRRAVFTLWIFAATLGISAILLGKLAPWQAGLVGVQVVLTLGLVALLEFTLPSRRKES